MRFDGLSFVRRAMLLLAILCVPRFVQGYDSPPAGTKTEAVDESVRVEENIVYGKGGTLDLQLDLAAPAEGCGPFPAIVYVHGGGWYTGSRSTYRNEIVDAARRGYVAVTVSYRLTDADETGKPRNPFPAQINDVKCAVRWLRANASRYRIDPCRIGAKGASAGGHLSLLLGVTDGSENLEGAGGHGCCSSRVQAVVNYFGPTDLPQLYTSSERVAPMLDKLLGAAPHNAAASYALASPITHLSCDDPPMLTIQGSNDRLVPLEQATRFDSRAREVRANHTLMTVEGAGHGFAGEAREQALQATFEFFDRHLKGCTVVK